jgi:hypothetical protein
MFNVLRELQRSQSLRPRANSALITRVPLFSLSPHTMLVAVHSLLAKVLLHLVINPRHTQPVCARSSGQGSFQRSVDK